MDTKTTYIIQKISKISEEPMIKWTREAEEGVVDRTDFELDLQIEVR